jgi:hypothetical protein
MEIGSLIIWIVIIFAFGVWAFTFFSKMKDDSKPNSISWVLTKLYLKLFFCTLPLSWISLAILKEITHPVVIVGSFYIAGLLSICALTIFLNLIESVRENLFFSSLSFFIIPLVVGVVVLQDLREDWPTHKSDFSIYLPIIVSFFAVEILVFMQFRRYLLKKP